MILEQHELEAMRQKHHCHPDWEYCVECGQNWPCDVWLLLEQLAKAAPPEPALKLAPATAQEQAAEFMTIQQIAALWNMARQKVWSTLQRPENQALVLRVGAKHQHMVRRDDVAQLQRRHVYKSPKTTRFDVQDYLMAHYDELMERQLTMQQVADQFSLSRERIRQIGKLQLDIDLTKQRTERNAEERVYVCPDCGAKRPHHVKGVFAKITLQCYRCAHTQRITCDACHSEYTLTGRRLAVYKRDHFGPKQRAKHSMCPACWTQYGPSYFIPKTRKHADQLVLSLVCDICGVGFRRTGANAHWHRAYHQQHPDALTFCGAIHGQAQLRARLMAHPLEPREAQLDLICQRCSQPYKGKNNLRKYCPACLSHVNGERMRRIIAARTPEQRLAIALVGSRAATAKLAMMKEEQQQHQA